MITFSRSARFVAAVTLAAGAVGLTACSAGRITQTSTQVAAVQGANADAGLIALRDLTIAFADKGYPKGGSAPLVVRIFNNAITTVKLVSVTSDKAASVEVASGPPAPGAPVETAAPTPTTAPTASASASASTAARASASATRPPTSAPPTTPASVARPSAGFPIAIPAGSYVLLVPGQGQYLELRGLTEALPPGVSATVTFTFDNGATATVQMPFALPTAPGPRATPEPIHAE